MEVLAPALEEPQPVVFSLRRCHFVSAEAIAILAGMKLLRDQGGLRTEIDTNTLDPKVKKVLNKSKLLKLFGHPPYPWTDTSLPIYVQRSWSKKDILNYIDQEILRRHEMPEMSKILQKEIRRAFFELFGNVFYHSQSPIGGLVCGQVYPKAKVKQIQIVFYDAGVGVAKRVREAVPSVRSDNEAIEWALESGTSTLSNHSEPRGLGLYVLRRFLDINGGEFRIYANQGVVEEIAGCRRCTRLRYGLKGTLIEVRIKVTGDVKYILSSEKEEYELQ